MKQTAAAARINRVALPGTIFVLLAMAVVTVGLAIGFYAQLGMPAWAAAVLALALLAGMVITHVAVLRGRQLAELEAEVMRLRTLLGPAADAPTTGQTQAELRNSSAGKLAESGAPQGDPSVGSDSAHRSPITRSLAEEIAMARAMAEPQSNTRSDPEPPQVAGRQLDTMAIQQLVKKLAEETGGPRAPSPADTAAESTPRAPAAKASTQSAAAPEPSVSGEDITKSVRALRATAAAMRPAAQEPVRAKTPTPQSAPVKPAVSAAVSASPPAATKEPATIQQAAIQPVAIAGPAPVGETPASTVEPAAASEEVEMRVGLLADALAADRMDVMLEPILGLKDQATRHYEISVRLRTETGEAVNPADEHDMLGGTGILPLIDIAKISRIAEVARRLAERGKTGAVFADLAGESLGDDDFLQRFAEIYGEREGITEQLVVALAQADMRVFADAHWDMVKDLGSVGFRFALDHVTDLDMDFDIMKAAGIRFVKLDAEVFLEGLPTTSGAHVPAADIVRFLSDKDLSLIVGEITDKAQLSRIVDCGVLFGNGRLFGGPRVVKAQVFAAKSAA